MDVFIGGFEVGIYLVDVVALLFHHQLDLFHYLLVLYHPVVDLLVLLRVHLYLGCADLVEYHRLNSHFGHIGLAHRLTSCHPVPASHASTPDVSVSLHLELTLNFAAFLEDVFDLSSSFRVGGVFIFVH